MFYFLFFSCYSIDKVTYCYRGKQNHTCQDPNPILLNSSEQLKLTPLSTSLSYDIEIYNDEEEPFELYAVTVASQNVAILGSEKTTIKFISEMDMVTIQRLKFVNVNVTFKHISGSSDFEFVEGDFEAYNSTLLGQFTIHTKNCMGDMITLSKLNRINSNSVDIYANEVFYDFEQNHRATLQFAGYRTIVHVHGFTQDTFVNLSKQDLLIKFVKTNAILHLNNSQFEIITTHNNTMVLNRIESSTYSLKNFVLVMENGANVKFNEFYNSTSPIILQSTRGGSIEFFNNIIIQNLFVSYGKLSIKHSDLLTIQSISLVDSILNLAAGDHDPKIESISITGKSLISRPSTTGKLELNELYMRDVPNIDAFKEFYLTISSIVVFSNTSAVFNSLKILESCEVKFEWFDIPTKGIFANELIIPQNHRIYITKNTTDVDKFLSTVTYTFCSPKLVDSFEYDYSGSDPANYGFTADTLLLEHKTYYISSNYCIGFKLTKNPRKVYPLVCYTRDTCNIEGAYVKKMREPLSDIPAETEILRIYTTSIIGEEDAIEMATLPNLSHKISIEIGVPGNHENPFTLFFEKPANDKISSIEFIESQFTILTRDNSYNFALDKIIIGDNVPIIIDGSKFTFKGTKYIKLPISLCNQFNIEEILNVKLTFPFERMKNVYLYKDKISLNLGNSEIIAFSTKISNITFAFQGFDNTPIEIYRKDKEVTPLYISDYTPYLKFNSDWDDYKGYAVYFGRPNQNVIVSVNSSYIPIKLLSSGKLLLEGHSVTYSNIYFPVQDVSMLYINIVSLYKINLIIDHPIFTKDVIIESPQNETRSGSNIYINDAVIEGISATFSGVLINGSLSAKPGSYIDLSKSQISSDTVINLSVNVGYTSSFINLSETIGLDELNVHWNISEPLLYAPYTSHEPILYSSSKISKDIWINFYPEYMKLKNGIVKAIASYNDKDLYASFDAVTYSHKKLNSAQVLAIITAAVTASIFLVLIVYTFVSTRKREQHGYERYLI